MLSTSKLVLTITLICAGATATADPDKRPDLRQIMQGLRDDSVLILDGLLINDLDKVTILSETALSGNEWKALKHQQQTTS